MAIPPTDDDSKGLHDLHTNASAILKAHTDQTAAAALEQAIRFRCFENQLTEKDEFINQQLIECNTPIEDVEAWLTVRQVKAMGTERKCSNETNVVACALQAAGRHFHHKPCEKKRERHVLPRSTLQHEDFHKADVTMDHLEAGHHQEGRPDVIGRVQIQLMRYVLVATDFVAAQGMSSKAVRGSKRKSFADRISVFGHPGNRWRAAFRFHRGQRPRTSRLNNRDSTNIYFHHLTEIFSLAGRSV